MIRNAVVLMGVCGCGKTDIGRRLAAGLGCAFYDGDDFHPPANIAKMRGGVPLTDEDRWPWLDALAAVLATSVREGSGVVVGCSALARRYRDRLGLPHPAIRLVHLEDPSNVIPRRLASRADHFMPASLLASQYEALERPALDEHALVVDVALSPDEIVRRIVTAL